MTRVLATPQVLPRFWIFMYRASPFTYLVSAVLSTGLTATSVQCSSIELLQISPPAGQNCSSYLGPYIHASKGNLLNPEATADCRICSISQTDQFLGSLNIYYSDLWRNVGLLLVYIVFNAAAAVFLYWLIRVPKKRSRETKTEE